MKYIAVLKYYISFTFYSQDLPHILETFKTLLWTQDLDYSLKAYVIVNKLICIYISSNVI